MTALRSGTRVDAAPHEARGPVPRFINAIPPGLHRGLIVGNTIDTLGYKELRAILVHGKPRPAEPEGYLWGFFESASQTGPFLPFQPACWCTRSDTHGIIIFGFELGRQAIRQRWMRAAVHTRGEGRYSYAVVVELIRACGEVPQ
jgi:hypothetical protein